MAEFILIVHVIWVLVVVLTVPVVLLGAWRGWRWVTNPWYRYTHLLMIGIVVAQSLLGINCPLTDWENDALRAAGRSGYERSFIGHWLHEFLYFDFEPWVFTAAYVAFGLAVAVLLWKVPPRRRKRHADERFGFQ